MDQQTALQLMKSGKNIFLTGQAGSGKTFVLNQYIQRCQDCEIPLAITASTGIAATHIGGVTIHSRSGIGIGYDLSDREIDDIANKPRVVSKIRKAKVLIIDEISMLSAQTLDDIERIVQAVKYDDRPWGGIQIIFCGDFFQLPPISKYGETTRKFSFAAQAWNHADLYFCYLDAQYRQSDTEFGEILNALRTGHFSDKMLQRLESRKDADLGERSYVRLYTHNIDVDRINTQELEKLDGEAHNFSAEKKGKKNLIEGLLRGMLTPEILDLKIGAKVLFTKNNPVLGYYNGTMGEIVDFDAESGYPVVRTNDGEMIHVEPVERMVSNDDMILAMVIQLPLKLARAITVHKSQGMTLDAAQIDLSKSFAHGQSYVALSRLRSLEGLSLLGLNRDGFQTHDLVSRGDTYFQQQSGETMKQFAALEQGDREELHRDFVQQAGGRYRSVQELETLVRTPKELVKKKQKTDTVIATMQLVQQGKKLDEIIKTRGLSRGTILKHLGKIRTLYPDLDLSYLKPKDLDTSRIQKAVDIVSEDEENFTEHGILRLRAVYEALGEEVSYDDIRLGVLFCD